MGLSRVDVLLPERLDGDSSLIVQYQGHTVATQEPPPRMGALWDLGHRLVSRT